MGALFEAALASHRARDFQQALALYAAFPQPTVSAQITRLTGLAERREADLRCRRIIDLVEAGDLVFDIGAHRGEKARPFLEQGCRLILVEPQPACLAVLAQRFADLPDVLIEPVGLADRSGVLPLSICEDAPTISTFSEAWKHGRFAGYRWEKSLLIPVTTLDDLVARHGSPTYCKIDVEGFEERVVAGLGRKIGILSLEYAVEAAKSVFRALDHLETLGYDRFNFCRAEDPFFCFGTWENKAFLIDYLHADADPLLWGDIYIDS